MTWEWVSAFIIGCATGFGVAVTWYRVNLEELGKRIDDLERHR